MHAYTPNTKNNKIKKHFFFLKNKTEMLTALQPYKCC